MKAKTITAKEFVDGSWTKEKKTKEAVALLHVYLDITDQNLTEEEATDKIEQIVRLLEDNISGVAVNIHETYTQEI